MVQNVAKSIRDGRMIVSDRTFIAIVAAEEEAGIEGKYRQSREMLPASEVENAIAGYQDE